ncbi:SPRY domain-containing SOCS box protein 3-like isoform X3 [Cotesia glomerata]|uniref:SPRY domain-containing SOCS box protein 3-like isoform X3 n=1 Tax=Cotesia glomerata TaxID=32391 RepID=UPI001D02B91C|nr:SPRY domain-containing SOCS box protein 3-like isoform X3 [Cotesia glomerata]
MLKLLLMVLVYEWAWDERLTSRKSLLSQNNLEVKFHPGYSDGTVAVRGDKILSKGRHHYWEVEMLSQIYGTDVMVGVGTAKVNINERDKFLSLLGQDRESWGLSYKGKIHYDGEIKDYSEPFAQGSVVGLHLDTWKAANSCMRITQSLSVPASLQMDCLGLLKPLHRSYLSTAFPGLRYLLNSKFAEVLRKKRDNDDSEDSEYEFPEEYLILDDFDFALVGRGRRKKKRIIH